MVWGAAAGASGGLGVLLLYRALAGGVVSTAAPLISMVALSVPVAVGLLGGERPGVLPLVGVALGCVAVTLISAHGESQDAPAATTRRLVLLAPALAAGVLIGVFLVCLARVQPGASGWPLVAGRGTAALLLFGMVFASRTPVIPPGAAYAPIVGAAITDVTANVLYLLAVQRGPLSLIATLVSLAPATTVLLAQVVLRERLGRMQRVGVALALVAVVLLSRG
jgi:drug/metabolite transporter (DMT)-like permease